MRFWIFLMLMLGASALAQPRLDAPNAVLLVAKPGMLDPTFRETVVLASQSEDSSTVGVILNRPTQRKHEQTGEPLWFGGPVMQQVIVSLYRSAEPPTAPAFHVLKGIYLSMHPEAWRVGNSRRLYMGFSGWAPGQLETELARDSWFVLPASAEILFRADTTGMWEELVQKARGRVALRQKNVY
jgi:putative transcriptional regulator